MAYEPSPSTPGLDELLPPDYSVGQKLRCAQNCMIEIFDPRSPYQKAYVVVTCGDELEVLQLGVGSLKVRLTPASSASMAISNIFRENGDGNMDYWVNLPLAKGLISHVVSHDVPDVATDKSADLDARPRGNITQAGIDRLLRDM